MDEALQKFKDVVKKMYDQGDGASKVDTDSLIGDGLVCLVKIKQENHNLSVETERLREQTGDRKGELDQKNLQLQNLLYEKMYYEKEIRACRSFQSEFTEDKIGLMSFEEFKSSAPAEFLQGCSESAHKTMLQRLSHELFLRKEMVKQLENVQAQKAQLTEQLKKQKGSVDGLRDQVAAVAEASKPLQDSLTPPLRAKHLVRLAELLPLPLYIIFSQFSSNRELLANSVEVTIHGSEEDADAHKQHVAQPGPSQAMDVDGQQPSKRARSEQLGLANGPGPSSPVVHPLTVQLRLSISDLDLAINFQHVHPLNIIFASCESAVHNDLLAGVFPNDTGDVDVFEGPPPSGLHPGAKPFRWAQHLAGQDLVPLLPSWTSMTDEQHGATLNALATHRGQMRVQTLMDSLKFTAESRAALKSILVELASRRSPKVDSQGKRPVCVLLMWSQVKEKLQAAAKKLRTANSTPTPTPPPSPSPLPNAETLVQAAEVAAEEEEGLIQEEGELEIVTPPPPQTPPNGLVDEVSSPMDSTDTSYPSHPSRAPSGAITSSLLPPPEVPPSEPEQPLSILEQLLEIPPPRCPSAPLARYSFKIRMTPVEVEGVISLHHQYPLQPPLLKVMEVRRVETDKRGNQFVVTKSTVITQAYVNAVDLMEKQFNLDVLALVPAHEEKRLLAYQVDQLRRNVDELAATVRNEGATSEHWKKLTARQRLQGRARHCLADAMI